MCDRDGRRASPVPPVAAPFAGTAGCLEFGTDPGGSIVTPGCAHLDHVLDVKPRTPEGCEECLKAGGWWVHLRLCMECGHVGCCDSSPNTHASKHFHASHHPIMRSLEPGEDWGFCFVDEMMFEPAPSPQK
jgi:hypothetical protein